MIRVLKDPSIDPVASGCAQFVSYDLTIKSDDRFSLHAPINEVRRILSRVKELRAGGTADFLYRDASCGLEFIAYLELVDEEGNSLLSNEAGDDLTINCVRMCISWDSLAHEGNQLTVLEFASGLAKQLRWRVYDEQAGEYLLEDYPSMMFAQMEASREAARSILQQLDSQPPAEEENPRRWIVAVALLLLAVAAVFAACIWLRRPSVPIHQAAARGDLSAVVRWLKIEPALANARDERGRTPLHHAAERNHRHEVMGLLSAGSDPNARDDGNWTPLHLAAAAGHEFIIELLLGRGGDAWLKNEDGKTVVDMADEAGHEDVARLLRRGGRTRMRK